MYEISYRCDLSSSATNFKCSLVAKAAGMNNQTFLNQREHEFDSHQKLILYYYL